VTENDSSRVRAKFDQYTVNLSSGELLRNGVRVPIQEKPLQILRLLIESDGVVVTRYQLRSALWSDDTFVDFEHGVNTAVKKLRHALEDSAEHPKFIETLPRYGYRFLVPVQWLENRPNVLPDETAASAVPSVPASSNKANGRKRIKSAPTVVVSLLVMLAILLSDRLGLVRTAREVADGRHVEAQTFVSQRRLTSNPDEMALTAGVISPDGKFLAYSDPSGFYLKHVDSGETHRITFPSGFEPTPESWFPDSVHLVAKWLNQKKPPSLWKISIMGGTPRKLADVGSSARVSPDGTKIAYLAGQWDIEEIWLMDADGSGNHKVVDGGQQGFGPAAWAPDSTRFGYVRGNDPLNADIKPLEIYNLSTGHTSVVRSDRFGAEMAWTGNGRLIFSLPEPEPNQDDWNLWSAQLDPRSGLLTGTPARITNDHSYVMGISMTADGKRLAVRRFGFQPDVYLSNIKGNREQLSNPRRFTFDERWDWPAAWTVDSKAVIFMSNRDGALKIYKQRIDETQPELLISQPDLISGAQLTPDGSDLLYLADAGQGKSKQVGRVMRVSLAGGSARTVVGSDVYSYQCARMPSTMCVYGLIKDNSEYVQLFAFDPDGVKPSKEIAKLKNEEGPIAWNLSPNGKYLVMQSRNPNQRPPTLRILELPSGGSRFVALPQVGLIMGTDWAADSNSVWVSAYMGRGAYGDRSAVLNVDLSGKSRVLLEKLNMGLWSAVPSPDGQHLALLGHTKSSNVTLLENF